MWEAIRFQFFICDRTKMSFILRNKASSSQQFNSQIFFPKGRYSILCIHNMAFIKTNNPEFTNKQNQYIINVMVKGTKETAISAIGMACVCACSVCAHCRKSLKVWEHIMIIDIKGVNVMWGSSLHREAGDHGFWNIYPSVVFACWHCKCLYFHH